MYPILIRYGEIGLKSPRIRKRFEQRLITNIEGVFQYHHLDCVIERQRGRMILYTDDPEPATRSLRNIFGIVSFSPAHETSAEIEALAELAIRLSKGSLAPDTSFAIRARRTGTHSYTSMDLARFVGAAIMDTHAGENISVDLNDPDVEIFIEVRDTHGYVFSEILRGPGGLPVGTQGKVVVIIHEDRSLLAAWLMMKRGCRILPIIFPATPPLESPDSSGHSDPRSPPHEPYRFERLREWCLGLKPLIKEPGWFEAPSSDLPRSVSMKMMAEAFALAEKKHASAVVTSETKAQLTQIISRKEAPLPIFYPLIGYDDDELERLFARVIESGVGSGE